MSELAPLLTITDADVELTTHLLAHVPETSVCDAWAKQAVLLWKELDAQRAACTALRQQLKEARQQEKRAPVQGYSAGIPWEMHLRAYDAYVKRHGRQQALIEGHCRGGFHTEELDMFVPGWRDELSTLASLRQQLAQAQQELHASKVTEKFALKQMQRHQAAVQGAARALGMFTADSPSLASMGLTEAAANTRERMERAESSWKAEAARATEAESRLSALTQERDALKATVEAAPPPIEIGGWVGGIPGKPLPGLAGCPKCGEFMGHGHECARPEAARDTRTEPTT